MCVVHQVLIPAGARRIVAPLAKRDFRLAWGGQAVSALGGPLQTVALAWLILDLTGSPVALSGALLAAALPSAALTLVGGVVTDRYSPRAVMLWSDAVRAVVTGLIAALAFTGALKLWLLYALLVLYGAASGLFSPAFQSIIPRLTPREQLPAANALAQATPQFALLVAAPVGGVLVALVGPAATLALNAMSFAIAALADAAITRRPRLPPKAHLSPLEAARAGLTHVRERRWLVALIAVDAAASLAVVGPLSIGLPLFARDRGNIGAAGLGLLLAAFGVGSMAGMFAAGGGALRHRGARQARGSTFCVLQCCQAPLLIALAFAPLPVAGILLAFVGLLNGVSAIMYLTLVQERVPTALLGRVMSFVAFGSAGLVPLSQLAAGVAAAAAGPSVLFTAAGALMLVAATGGLLSRPLRQLD